MFQIKTDIDKFSLLAILAYITATKYDKSKKAQKSFQLSSVPTSAKDKNQTQIFLISCSRQYLFAVLNFIDIM